VPVLEGTELTELQQELRTLELSVAEESSVPHSGWTHFADLVMRGVLPHAAVQSWPVAEDALDALDAPPLRTGRRSHSRSVLLELGPELFVYLLVNYGHLSVWVAAADEDALDRVYEWARERFPELASEDGRVPVSFWSLGPNGASCYTRQLDVPAWDVVAPNYPVGVRAQLAPVLAGDLPRESGKLLLWHGEPGTGKTHVVRALAWQWRDWCDIHYVTDPEEFFGRAGYMLEVLVNEDDDDDEERWRLLVLEDTGELLSADAKERTGQGLSRFLNVVDGLLGQGLRLLVLVTTNELLRNLHPAVSRPGRCASAVEFTPFPPEEAAEWLAARGHDPDARYRTLAELYARAAGHEPPRESVRRPIGF
jgi:hypothetical protein